MVHYLFFPLKGKVDRNMLSIWSRQMSCHQSLPVDLASPDHQLLAKQLWTVSKRFARTKCDIPYTINTLCFIRTTYIKFKKCRYTFIQKIEKYFIWH